MEMKPHHWRFVYNELAGKRFSLGKTMLFDSHGPLGSVFVPDGETAVIFVEPKLTWKQKVMVLAHEYGHIASLGSDGKLKRLPKPQHSESYANATALHLLTEYNIGWGEYQKFYESRHAIQARIRRMK
jgi:hypothetical protein